MKKDGISLIVLIITIVVIIILAGAAILSLSLNDPIGKAQEAKFKSNLDVYKSDLSMTYSDQFIGNKKFSQNRVNVGPWNGDANNITGTVKEYIPSMSTVDGPNFEIQEGVLVYIGTDATEKAWANDVGISSSSPTMIYYVESKGVNRPELGTGLTAIKWGDNAWTNISDPAGDLTWYDYTIQTSNTSTGGTSQWANAFTQDGSMWVWIPRFAYKITNPGTSTPSSIDIIFLDGKTNYLSDGSSLPPGYIVHPAFTKNIAAGGWDAELSGFWIAKYEAGFAMTSFKDKLNLTNLTYSGTINTTNYYGAVIGGTTTMYYPVFKANRYSYNNLSQEDSYRLMKSLTSSGNPYGFDAAAMDVHLIKNSEWGAVAYLAQSKYGRNGTEIATNITNANNTSQNVYSITAGGNGSNGLAADYSAAVTTNKLQSSTGNVYGVFDLSGGAWERVAAYINNGSTSLTNNGPSLYNEGGTGTSTKYKTVYAYNSVNDIGQNNYLQYPNNSRKGEAMWETSTSGDDSVATSWFGDLSSFLYGNTPWMARGGTYFSGNGTAGTFAFIYSVGAAANATSTRATIVVY